MVATVTNVGGSRPGHTGGQCVAGREKHLGQCREANGRVGAVTDGLSFSPMSPHSAHFLS